MAREQAFIDLCSYRTVRRGETDAEVILGVIDGKYGFDHRVRNQPVHDAIGMDPCEARSPILLDRLQPIETVYVG